MRHAALVLALLVAACGQRESEVSAVAAPPQFEAPAGAGREARLAHGARLARVLGCRGCHGQALQGEPWMEEPAGAVLFTSNLTREVPRYDDAQLARAIREGVRFDGSDLWEMPSSTFTQVSEPDMAALILYLRSLPPAGPVRPRMALGPEGRREIAAGTLRPAAAWVRAERGESPARLDGRHELARYMVRATCGECHGLDLAGSDDGRTPDMTIAGAYDRIQFRHLLRTGIPIGGRPLRLMGDVARDRFAHLTDREVDSIYDYLKARAGAAR